MISARRVAMVAAVFCGLLLASCGGGEQPTTTDESTTDPSGQAEDQTLEGEVRIAGSSTVYPLTTAMAEEFIKRNRGVSIPVSSTGTGGGFENFFCRGKTDINNASRPIHEAEKELCTKNNVDPIELQIAIDAVTVVVNEKADWVDCMTVEELRRFWKPGGADRWSQVRPEWPDREIEFYGAASTSGTFDYFTAAIVGEEDSHRQDYQATEHDNTIVQAVSGSRDAMGYFGFAYYRRNTDRVKAVAVDSGEGCVEPTPETAQTGKYSPLSRPLFVYVDRNELSRPEVKQFAEFYVKQSTGELVSQVGYVPVNESTVDSNLDKLSMEP